VHEGKHSNRSHKASDPDNCGYVPHPLHALEIPNWEQDVSDHSEIGNIEKRRIVVKFWHCSDQDEERQPTEKHQDKLDQNYGTKYPTDHIVIAAFSRDGASCGKVKSVVRKQSEILCKRLRKGNLAVHLHAKHPNEVGKHGQRDYIVEAL
jgi:hypothetical protein